MFSSRSGEKEDGRKPAVETKKKKGKNNNGGGKCIIKRSSEGRRKGAKPGRERGRPSRKGTLQPSSGGGLLPTRKQKKDERGGGEENTYLEGESISIANKGDVGRRKRNSWRGEWGRPHTSTNFSELEKRKRPRQKRSSFKRKMIKGGRTSPIESRDDISFGRKGIAIFL